MDSLLQAPHEKRGSDESQPDPAGPLMSRLSNSTWASELDYFQDPVAASGALPGTPGSFPPLVSSETASHLSMGDFGLCGNPLAGLTLWTTDGVPSAGLGITGIQGLLQSNTSTYPEIDGRELPSNYSFFLLPQMMEDQLAQDPRTSPEPPPDGCTLQQAEPTLSTPSNHTETRWTRSDSLPAQYEFEKPLSIRSSRKRGRDSECRDAFGLAAGLDPRFEHAKLAAAAKAAEGQQIDHLYALLPFDPAMGSDTRSLDQAGLQHQLLSDQLGTGNMCESQQALSCLSPLQLADIKYETVNLGEYDMCEVSVSWHLPRLHASPDWPADAVPVRRVFGINAGMTLFNLHRIICISMGLSDDVPRCIATGTYGTAPPSGTDWNSSAEICSHVPSFHVDVHEINTQFIDTRFSKNTSFSRRTKMMRAEGIDEDILRCYSESIQEFWHDPDRVRDLSIRVTRQSMGGSKRRCIEGRKAQRAIEREESCEDSSQAQERGTRSEDLSLPSTHDPPAVSVQQQLGSLAWHESPASLEAFISMPHLDPTYSSDPQGDPPGVLGVPTCPSPAMSLSFPFTLSSDAVCCSPSSTLSSTLATGMQQRSDKVATAPHAVDSTEDSIPNSGGLTAVAQAPDDFVCGEGSGSGNGMRRSKRINDKRIQNQPEDDGRYPLKPSSIPPEPKVKVNELPLPLSISAGSTNSPYASPSKTGLTETNPSCSAVSKEGSCCSTNPGDYDIADFRLLAGVLDDEASRGILSVSPESIEPVDFTAQADDQGHESDWPTTQPDWRSVQFVLTQDHGINMEPRNSAQTAC
ncbi:conserved hypothetical protein [Neospora caninum Liverpool]|uniref:Uncharacterized protein n=1 Tax=Neospora caninum (strain Liverpool) TaxID=572307 RepID=F0VDP4_NEOCL|nr:conserved hypothetical protein [Neospora caninum Liverpool]CBZ51837.1 conserved hypothetical protein [Neospora caninum Liverpool]CEL65795.1 TPA: hypothetical protein BN1204_016290 [Neospora caninum Liverpool]|eukprot:XP_003881870.1 conserved hypothetical protein [Neospora caninum Liverpool]